MMIELTDRQKLILNLIIQEYTRSATPVGSESLVERCRLDISSATVRNEMKVLTDLGLLRKPHDQSGRVPTEEGYRFFVGHLLNHADLPVTTQRMISHQFFQMRYDVEQWMRLAASVLASQSRAASLVTAPHPEQLRFKHVELISTRGRQVLMVLVLAGGEVHQRLLTLAEPVSQEQLSAASDRITRVFQNQDLTAISLSQVELDSLSSDVLEWIRRDMRDASALVTGDIFLDGLGNVLSEPEFSASEDARRAIRVLEDSSFLKEVLSRTVLTGNLNGVQVLIGGEGTWEDLRQWSIVLARYGSPGQTTGTLGVLGPIRMPYGRAISTVRFLSDLLSNLIQDTLAEGEE